MLQQAALHPHVGQAKLVHLAQQVHQAVLVLVLLQVALPLLHGQENAVRLAQQVLLVQQELAQQQAVPHLLAGLVKQEAQVQQALVQ